MIRELLALSTEGELRAPMPGWFRATIAADHLVAPGDPIGELEVLGRTSRVIVPARVRGLAKLVQSDGARAVGYGDLLLRVVAGSLASADADVPTEPHSVTGLVFRAPTSGRYYSRPTPEKPAFITVGGELAPGTTVCLLEVMKTFNRVTYSGARVRVTELLVADGADVNAGDPLLALETI
ncbi:acetyl-CoA carboxylase biotin carboxyl carrier protein [soil metagenome]